MSRIEKLIEKVLSGKSDNNFSFEDLRKVVMRYGFKERVSGSHHIYTLKNFNILLNLQKDKSSKAKPYQVRQVRKIILEYFPNT